jgi:D-arabinose 1-dehydrogenase-like Zn-dependent alcohol dehydrogenase
MGLVGLNLPPFAAESTDAATAARQRVSAAQPPLWRNGGAGVTPPLQRRLIMRAVRFVGVGQSAQITDVIKPAPGPGQVLIEIGGAGVCHSDLHVMEEDFGFSGTFTLGHENAGWVAHLGEGVRGLKEGDAVAVYGPWGCGRCHACQQSMENYSGNWAEIGAFGGGLGFDGGMAEYMLVPSARLLVPLGGLNPAKAAPLSDAALMPYHAIKRALPQLNADRTVVVVGIGGLGHMAVQLVRVCASSRPMSMRRSWSRRRRSAQTTWSTRATLTRPPSRYGTSPARAAPVWCLTV